MSGVFFVVCVPTCEHEAELKKNNRRDRIKAHSDTTINFSNEDITTEVKRCRSTNDFALSPEQKVNGSASKVVKQRNGVCTKPEISPSKTPWGDIKQAVTSKKSSTKTIVTSPLKTQETTEQEVALEKVVIAVLEHARVKDAAWCHVKEKEYFQVSFSLEGGAACEEVLHLFGLWGVGKKWNSVVSVIPCALYYHANGYRDSQSQAGHNTSCQNGNIHSTEDGHGFCGKMEHKGICGIDQRSAWSKFVSSVRTRLTVAQVVQLIRADAALTFDWLFLLIVSAFVAAIGLVENSTVFLVASMLISPLMGPIMAGTFGTAIRDRDLQKIGVLHELLGLFLALVIGFLFGLVLCLIDENYGDGDWPTYEMMSRCDLRSLWVGALIAVPSGAAVAIAVLGDNTASLVGVAISASLLPPAVNAGLLWAMALIHLIFLDDETRFTNVVKTSVYSSNPASELAVDGTISLCLTLVNIVCIYFAGIFVYKVKKVGPVNTEVISFLKKEDVAAKDSNIPKDLDRQKIDNTNEDKRERNINEILEKNDYGGINNKTGLHNWNCFRARTPLFSACTGNNATWSPATFGILSRPHLRDIENYYEDCFNKTANQAENPSLVLPASNRRNSISRNNCLFYGCTSTADNIRHLLGSKRYTHLPEESLPKVEISPSHSEIDKIERNSLTSNATSSKFTVTPVPSSSTPRKEPLNEIVNQPPKLL